jgi:uncharacterized protein YndB with AHSA1/START domain
MSTQTTTKPSLTLQRRFNAAPARVFSAWTDPQKIVRWFGPEQVEVVRAEADPRTGGRYRIVARSPDGDEHDVSGEYREVVQDTKLVFTWAWRSTPERQSLVTLTFKPDGDGTLLTLQHEQFFDEPARDRHQHGWTGSLEKLDRYLAAAD